jgi:hypothetical protein
VVGLYACGYTAVTVQGGCECHKGAECAGAACRASNMSTALHARSSPPCEPAGCWDVWQTASQRRRRWGRAWGTCLAGRAPATATAAGIEMDGRLAIRSTRPHS